MIEDILRIVSYVAFLIIFGIVSIIIYQDFMGGEK